MSANTARSWGLESQVGCEGFDSRTSRSRWVPRDVAEPR